MKKHVLQDAVRLFRLSYRLSPANVWVTLVQTLIQSAKTIVMLLLPAMLLDVIAQAKTYDAILWFIVLFAGITTVADMSFKALRLQETALSYALGNRAAMRVGRQTMKMDYGHWEKAESLTQCEKAVCSTWVVSDACDLLVADLLPTLLSLGIVSYILIQINVWFWPIMLGMAALNLYFERKHAKKRHALEMQKAAAEKHLNYNRGIIRDLKYGKEIRLFDAVDFIERKFVESSQAVLAIEKAKARLGVGYGAVFQGIAFAQSVAAYALAIAKFTRDTLSMGYFLVFYNAIRQFTSSLDELLTCFSDWAELSE